MCAKYPSRLVAVTYVRRVTETASATITSVPRVGIGVILRRGTEVLLGNRRGSHGAGVWAFPGGKVDPGESEYECSRRELGEETGIWLPVEAFRKVHFWTNDLFPEDDAHFLTGYLVADAPAAVEPRLMEPRKCEAWDWFEWEQGLPTLLFGGIIEMREQYPTIEDLLAPHPPAGPVVRPSTVGSCPKSTS